MAFRWDGQAAILVLPLVLVMWALILAAFVLSILGMRRHWKVGLPVLLAQVALVSGGILGLPYLPGVSQHTSSRYRFPFQLPPQTETRMISDEEPPGFHPGRRVKLWIGMTPDKLVAFLRKTPGETSDWKKTHKGYLCQTSKNGSYEIVSAEGGSILIDSWNY